MSSLTWDFEISRKLIYRPFIYTQLWTEPCPLEIFEPKWGLNFFNEFTLTLFCMGVRVDFYWIGASFHSEICVYGSLKSNEPHQSKCCRNRYTILHYNTAVYRGENLRFPFFSKSANFLISIYSSIHQLFILATHYSPPCNFW